MAIELTRLAVGLLLLIFHRPVADCILRQEQALALLLRQRGVYLPAPLQVETAHTIYFWLGTFAVLYQLARFWLSLHY